MSIPNSILARIVPVLKRLQRGKYTQVNVLFWDGIVRGVANITTDMFDILVKQLVNYCMYRAHVMCNVIWMVTVAVFCFLQCRH